MAGLVPLGDRAFLARFASETDARAWRFAVQDRGWPWVVDLVLAYHTVGVFLDPDRIEPAHARELLLSAAVPEGAAGLKAGRLRIVPVLYDGEDLPDVAERLGLTIAQTIAIHSGTDYYVFAIGFLPGFPYAGDLPAPLAGLPRHSSPRTRVPAGSVAIAGRQTAIYPQESPGGWRLLGRTPLKIVDLDDGWFPIQAGDRLRFVPIDPQDYERRRGERLE